MEIIWWAFLGLAALVGLGLIVSVLVPDKKVPPRRRGFFLGFFDDGVPRGAGELLLRCSDLENPAKVCPPEGPVDEMPAVVLRCLTFLRNGRRESFDVPAGIGAEVGYEESRFHRFWPCPWWGFWLGRERKSILVGL